MIFHSKDLESAWERVREDEYWLEGVWDRGKVRVEEFVRAPEGYLEEIRGEGGGER